MRAHFIALTNNPIKIRHKLTTGIYITRKVFSANTNLFSKREEIDANGRNIARKFSVSFRIYPAVRPFNAYMLPFAPICGCFQSAAFQLLNRPFARKSAYLALFED